MEKRVDCFVRTEVEDVNEPGNVYEVEFLRVTYWDTDVDYGADGDGRRGVRKDFIDEDRAENVRVKVGERYVPVTDVGYEVRHRVEAAVSAWLELNEAVRT